ncbi:MAG: 16S rRNA (guanine(527)-N(7))-methyltransferase RsmG [Halioglobus sp.]|nr:16S rRNA (guanine(527)-N(7))-methyltransferase RsmG [Halioglobus sp.]
MSADSPDSQRDLARTLGRGCEALGISAQPQQLERLLQYLALLGKWNRAYNLTAVRDVRDMVTRHLLDSLAVVPHIRESRLLDVGTGAGLPGVPLAIMFADRQWHLLDSNGKKTRFLFQVKTALGLDNMVIHQARVETFNAEEPYEAVLSRAFASLDDMVRGCRHLLTPGGRFLAMKGAYPAGELAGFSGPEFATAVHALSVPGLDEERHLVDIRPRSAASAPSGT